MKNYYKNLFLETVNNLQEKKSILLHSCCGPCSSYVIQYLSNWFDITVIYYNPNISPDREYFKRKEEQIRLINDLGKGKFLDCDYDNEVFERAIRGTENEPEGGKRCSRCFRIRLEKCASVAKEMGFDFFCSTLTVSPYKNAEVINMIGHSVGERYGVKWLYSDFKKDNGYKDSIELSKKFNLYRQNYCGCKYSERKETDN